MSIFVFPGKMSLVYCGGPLAKASDLKSLHLPNKGKWLAANFPTKASGNGDKHLSSTYHTRRQSFTIGATSQQRLVATTRRNKGTWWQKSHRQRQGPSRGGGYFSTNNIVLNFILSFRNSSLVWVWRGTNVQGSGLRERSGSKRLLCLLFTTHSDGDLRRTLQ